jgi:GT2 family glycosyltransferase
MTLPKVSIIITAFNKDHKRYLDACVASVKNLNYPKELLDVSIVSHVEYNPTYPDTKTINFPDKNYHNPAALNRGFREADPDSKFFLMLNDDTIVTKNSLKNMISVAVDENLIVGPIAPCDNYWLYYLHFSFASNNEFIGLSERFYKYEHLAPYINDLMNAESHYPKGLLFQPFLCLFAHLVPRKVWNAVGEFDENFKTGQDDVDYCWRARNKGFLSAVALDSFIFHFGGISSDKGIDQATRQANQAYFKEKWGVAPPC